MVMLGHNYSLSYRNETDREHDVVFLKTERHDSKCETAIRPFFTPRTFMFRRLRKRRLVRGSVWKQTWLGRPNLLHWTQREASSSQAVPGFRVSSKRISKVHTALTHKPQWREQSAASKMSLCSLFSILIKMFSLWLYVLKLNHNKNNKIAFSWVGVIRALCSEDLKIYNVIPCVSRVPWSSSVIFCAYIV